MKELVVISGKGGTGKTSLVSSFAALAKNAVLADCDVDASDLHLMLQPEIEQQHDFFGMKKAVIKKELCSYCGACETVCRFDAIKDFQIESFNCEGCGVCFHVCPVDAIQLEDNVCGQWFKANTRYGPFIYAQLGLGEENSGKLVTEVRKQAKDLAKYNNHELIIIDGPPGVGCPVIATLTGVDLVLVVTEPTVSGLHDLKRVLELVEHFKAQAAVCVNKWDLDESKCLEIENYCREKNINFIGKIPFDQQMIQAVIQGIPPVEYGSGGAVEEIKRIWHEVRKTINV